MLSAAVSTDRVDYSVVVPAWNESSSIARTLASIHAAGRDQGYVGEVIVVDNNSTDETAAIARANGARVVFEPINQIARARNAGAATASGRWLVFVDADTEINSELLRTVFSALASGRVVGGGSTIAFDQELTGLSRLGVQLWNWWSVRSATAAGCFVFSTADAFHRVGGFDEKQYVAEELYLSRELRKVASQNQQRFTVFPDHPVLSSARKKDWYSKSRIAWQIFLLLLPGASRSKRLCGVWYDRSHLN